MGNYPQWFRDEVVAWYATKNALEAVISYESEKQSKRKGRR